MKRPGIEIAQNQPRFGIWAGDLRSRSLHVDLHAELHHVENRRPADSAPYFTRLARFSFNWRDPSPGNVKSSCFPRHKTGLWKGNGRVGCKRPGSKIG